MTENIKISFSDEKVINYTISILIIFLPFSLVSGPFLSDFSISLISVLFIYLSLRYRLSKYYLSRISVFFLIFYIILNLSSVFSEDIVESSRISILYFRYYIFSLALWYIIELFPKLLRYLLFSFVICLFCLILDGFYQFSFGKNIIGWEIIDTRVSSFFKDELVLGSFLSRVFPIVFALIIFNIKFFLEKNINLILIFILLVSIEILTFLSGERVAFFYLNLSAIYLIIMMKNYKIFRIATLFFALLTIATISIYAPEYKERIFDRTLDQIVKDNEKEDILSKDNIYIFSQEHTNHYKSAYKMFNENKFLGIGPRMFREKCNVKKYVTSFESCSNHPHNNYLQVLAEIGSIGLLFFFIPFFSLIYFSTKHLILKFFYKKYLFSDFQISLLSCFLITLWPFVPTGDFFNNWLNIIYFFPLGIFLYSLETQKFENK
tara:strand:- start:890 stop:2194 length:1305 start_codon:yes stop_codon:yes gene_type:complete